MRVMNLASYPVTLQRGTVLGSWEPVEVVESGPGTASGPEVDVGAGLPDCVQTLLKEVNPSVPLEGQQRLTRLLVEYSPVFSQSEGDLGRANAVRHRIDTGPHRPFRQALRRQPNVYLDVIDGQVDEMIERRLVEPACSSGPLTWSWSEKVTGPSVLCRL